MRDFLPVHDYLSSVNIRALQIVFIVVSMYINYVATKLFADMAVDLSGREKKKRNRFL